MIVIRATVDAELSLDNHVERVVIIVLLRHA